MAVTPFKPQFMKVGVLTAALQELTPREKRDPDPDLAIEEWLAFAQELGANYIQLSAALHPTETDIPPEAMLDPVANTHGDARWVFAAGAMAASLLWFFALALGARYLSRWLSTPRAWRILDGVIAVVMIGIGISLVLPH